MTRLEAMADPVRLRMVRRLEAAPGASLPELATAAGVHLNTARPHAVALEAAGIIERESPEPVGRGRPRVGYRLTRDWSPPTTDFRGLAEVLALALLRGGHEPGELRAVGLEWGRYLHGRPGGAEVERDLPLALERMGFQARVRGSALELSACPCRLVLPDRPQLICSLAAAVVDGVLAGSGSELRVRERRHDPEKRRCSLGLQGARPRGTARRRVRRPRNPAAER
jgi:predicted ArsR family transcriptional regulator